MPVGTREAAAERGGAPGTSDADQRRESGGLERALAGVDYGEWVEARTPCVPTAGGALEIVGRGNSSVVRERGERKGAGGRKGPPEWEQTGWRQEVSSA